MNKKTAGRISAMAMASMMMMSVCVVNAAAEENEAESQFIIERRQLYSSLRRYAVGHRFKETGKRYQVDDNLRCKQGYDRVHSKETRKEQFRSRSLDMARRSSDNPRIGGTL